MVVLEAKLLLLTACLRLLLPQGRRWPLLALPLRRTETKKFFAPPSPARSGAIVVCRPTQRNPLAARAAVFDTRPAARIVQSILRHAKLFAVDWLGMRDDHALDGGRCAGVARGVVDARVRFDTLTRKAARHDFS